MTCTESRRPGRCSPSASIAKSKAPSKNDHVFFPQADFASGKLFPEATIHTFTTFSLTHEIESYLGRESLLRFGRLIHQQLAPCGRWINLDVIGPDVPERLVHMKLATDDGRNDDYQRQFRDDDRQGHRDYLAGLSTFGKFLRCAGDFRAAEGYRLAFEIERADDGVFAVLSLRDAAEFLSKKDYLDNWRSEMHESFCFWRFADWRAPWKMPAS